MNINHTINLKELIEESDFQKIQDEIATATSVAMITVDYSGTPVTRHSECNEFCQRIRSDDRYKHLCEKCDSRGGVEAARLKQPYAYICHMGIVDFAIPIIVNDLYMGAVMAGQLLISDYKTNSLERIVSVDSFPQLTDSRLLESYKKLHKIALDKIIALSKIIFYFCNSYIKDSIEKNGVSLPLPSNLDKSNNIAYNRAKALISPAIDYIDKNYRHNITLDFIADLCQISNSYLSRLFKKVVGSNYVAYVNLVRISHAKRILSATNKSISDIALELGYEESGYFIKVFKKIEGVTPNQYRNQNISITNSSSPSFDEIIKNNT